MKLCSSSSAKFVALSSWVVVALVGLLLAQQVVAFTPLSSVNVHTTRPKTTTTTTTPKAAASLTVTTTPDRTVESSSRPLVDTTQRKRQSYPHHNYRRRQQRRQGGGKYRVQHMTSRQQQGGGVVKAAPIVDVEPPLVQQQENQRSELVNVIGLKPKDLQPWTTLGQGTTVSGCVIVKVLPYGFLVQTNYDIPGKKSLGVALLHHRNIPAGTLENGDLTLGTVIDNARVIKVNRRQGTVNLSLKPARRDVFAPTPLAVGEQVEAKVVKIVPYGAFLDIGHPQRQALLHVSRMSVYKVHEITDHVQLGQTVQARIIHLSDKGDIGVSILSPENDAFVDRRQLQSKRMDLWRQVVRSADDPDDATSRKAKQELLEVDAQLWELLSGYMDTPRTSEV